MLYAVYVLVLVGINVARLAGLPQYVIALAVEQSRRFEKDTRQQSEGQVHAVDAISISHVVDSTEIY